MEVAFIGYFLIFRFDLFYLAGDNMWGSLWDIAIMVEKGKIYIFLEEFLFLSQSWWNIMFFQSFFHNFCHVFQVDTNKLMFFYFEAILVI